MKLSELTKELKEGKHVRRDFWEHAATICLQDGFMKCFRNGEIVFDAILDITAYFESDDWSVVEEEKAPETHLKKRTTKRGFIAYEFLDTYKRECAIRESSLSDGPCLWLEMIAHNSVHLNRQIVVELLPILEFFVSFGRLP